MTSILTVFAAIDTANAGDPKSVNGRPAALVYGERMTIELDRLFPDAPDLLRIAARGQHIERWLLPRSDFPAGREGYLEWRREEARRHGERLGAIMRAAGYSDADADRVGTLVRKEGIKRDAEVQALEDVICFVFLRWYFTPFAAGRSEEELLRIVTKAARKMSEQGRAQVRAEFALPHPFAAAFHD